MNLIKLYMHFLVGWTCAYCMIVPLRRMFSNNCPLANNSLTCYISDTYDQNYIIIIIMPHPGGNLFTDMLINFLLNIVSSETRRPTVLDFVM